MSTSYTFGRAVSRAEDVHAELLKSYPTTTGVRADPFRNELVLTFSAALTPGDLTALADWVRDYEPPLRFADGALYDFGENFDQRTVDVGGVDHCPWMFSKSLAHDPATGFATKEDVDALVRALQFPSKANRDSIVRAAGAVRRPAGIHDGLSYTQTGAPTSSFTLEPHLAIDSKESVFEMVEIYEMALLRDRTFHEIQTASGDADIDRAVASLNAFGSAITAPLYGGVVTQKSLFRGTFTDEEHGPLVSQFLVVPHNHGGMPIDQMFLTEPNVAASVTDAGWLDMQDGKTPMGFNFTGQARLCTPRGVGCVSHMDPLFQFYYNAAIIGYFNAIMLDNWQANDTNVEAFASCGPPDFLAAVAHIANVSLRAGMYVKWMTSMKVRPEVLAQRIDFEHRGKYAGIAGGVPGMSDIMTHLGLAPATMAAVRAANGVHADASDNSLLPMVFPEGSPVHPTWPAGHGVIGGACVTVLKAAFKCHDASGNRLPWIFPYGHRATVRHSTDGATLVDYTEGDEGSCTIVGELNKIVSNVSLGRVMAGMHYRTDCRYGAEFGERIAMSYLEEKAKEYIESSEGIFEGWVVQKFDGSIVRITATGIKPFVTAA